MWKFKHEIKLFGLPKSGTNYLKAFVELNYNSKVYVNKYGWKHGICRLKRPIHLLICVKNLYSWLYSFHLFCNTKIDIVTADFQPTTFSSFIRNPIQIQRRFWEKEEVTPESRLFENPIQYWNLMNDYWLSLEFTKTVIYYDKFLQNKQLEYPISPVRQLDIKERLIPSIETTIMDVRLFDAGFYLNHDYLNSFTESDYKFIERQNIADKLKIYAKNNRS